MPNAEINVEVGVVVNEPSRLEEPLIHDRPSVDNVLPVGNRHDTVVPLPNSPTTTVVAEVVLHGNAQRLCTHNARSKPKADK